MGTKTLHYYIGDLANETGLSQRAIRFYEEIGIIKPSRTESGYRVYSDADLDMLKLIVRFKDLGMSLDEIRMLFKPAEEVHGSDAMLRLSENLLAKKKEFEKKVLEFKNGIEEIENILLQLKKCDTCNDHVPDNRCKACISKREESGEHIASLIATRVSTESEK